MRLLRISPTILSLLVCLAGAAGAQAPDTPSQPSPDERPGAAPRQGSASARPVRPKPYKEVITGEAKSEPGVFTVHRLNEKIYYEIPPTALGREMLWSTEIAQLPAGHGYGGTSAGSRVVRWVRRENRVFLRDVSYAMRGDGAGAVQKAVAASSLEPIVMAFDIEAEGENKAPVIDVTRLLTTDVAEFSVKQTLGAGSVDAARSYIEQVKSFPSNIEARSLLTFQPTPSGGSTPPIGGRRGGGSRSSVSALVHYSMVLLPEKPMAPRYFDARVGYFTVGFDDYAARENRVMERRYVARYRLEKKDPSAALSEPVKPIVYYISREVPEKWRPYVKQGVEDWREAFEAAGFKNAIECRQAPTEAEDPRWDPEDVRYSVIRWAANKVANAMGPHVSDPRTGEILSAHIIVWHDVLKLNEMWYFVQAGPLDPRARKLPLPEPLMGDLLRYVVAHEVGHTLGLRHNHKGSSSYTVAQLRSKAFTEKNGDEASIMDYGRMNYVAQPGDNARLIPKLGPYDSFAIEWGYTPIPGAHSPEGEKPALDRMAARQVHNPMLRFGGEDSAAASDPTVQTEDLSSDPIQATTYGLANIARVARMLIPATTKLGEDYSLLNEAYDALLNQRRMELTHVAKLVGGVVETRYNAGRGADVFRPVPREKQAQAVRYLVANALTVPKELIRPGILNRVEPSGVTDRILGAQRAVISSLLSETRVKRMIDHQALATGAVYTVEELVTDLQKGVWNELTSPRPVVDLYRRNLQRAYLQIWKGRLVGEGASQTDLRPIGRGALRDLGKEIDRTLPRTKDRLTSLHLQECRKEIDRILNPLGEPASGPATAPPVSGRRGMDAEPLPFRGCWEPYRWEGS
jgi:Met-zincin/Domain of unknown function (DUF5117)/Domain of unknown function (DUF5118)